MKQILIGISAALAVLVVFGFTEMVKPQAENYTFQQITVIESVVPGGLGRSRMIATNPKGKLEEVKMKNFFSMTGINFSNIRENDMLITNKIDAMHKDGWELANVTSGVYSTSSVEELTGGTGIFITRYLFKKEVE